MLLTWLKQRRRRRLAAQPFPAAWDAILARNVADDSLLAADERAMLRRMLHIFVTEKHWEGCDGLEMTDEIRVTIAAQACLLTLGRGVSDFDQVLSILVYPADFPARTRRDAGGGLFGQMFIEGEEDHLGQAWYRGPVILAWPEVLAGGRRETAGRNVVVHEFAHQLDFLNGRVVNGTPTLDSPEQSRRWEAVMSRDYERLCDACSRGENDLLDCYGTQDRAEFFAVTTEAFFAAPVRLQRRHAELYELLRDFYHQDPAERVLRPRSKAPDPHARELRQILP